MAKASWRARPWMGSWAGPLQEGRCGLESPTAPGHPFWVIFHSSYFQEGNKESWVSRLSLRDLGLQASLGPGHPPSKVRH